MTCGFGFFFVNTLVLRTSDLRWNPWVVHGLSLSLGVGGGGGGFLADSAVRARRSMTSVSSVLVEALARNGTSQAPRCFQVILPWQNNRPRPLANLARRAGSCRPVRTGNARCRPGPSAIRALDATDEPSGPSVRADRVRAEPVRRGATWPWASLPTAAGRGSQRVAGRGADPCTRGLQSR